MKKGRSFPQHNAKFSLYPTVYVCFANQSPSEQTSRAESPASPEYTTPRNRPANWRTGRSSALLKWEVFSLSAYYSFSCVLGVAEIFSSSFGFRFGQRENRLGFGASARKPAPLSAFDGSAREPCSLSARVQTVALDSLTGFAWRVCQIG